MNTQDMTASDVFREGVKRLMEQGAPAIDDVTLTCLYCTADDKKCFVGHFIPDNRYLPEMENQSPGIDTAHDLNSVLTELYPNVAFSDWREMQTKLHDRISLSRNFVEQLDINAKRMAEEKGWEYNILPDNK